MSLDTPAGRLKDRELTDEEIEKIANYEKPSWAGRDHGARSVVTVTDTGDGIEIGDPRTLEGGVSVNWNDNVLCTFSASGISEEQVRDAFQKAKQKAVGQKR